MKDAHTLETDEETQHQRELITQALSVDKSYPFFGEDTQTLFSKFIVNQNFKYFNLSETGKSFSDESIFCNTFFQQVCEGVPYYWYISLSSKLTKDIEYDPIQVFVTNIINDVNELGRCSKAIVVSKQSIDLNTTMIEPPKCVDFFIDTPDEKSTYLSTTNVNIIGESSIMAATRFCVMVALVSRNWQYKDCKKMGDVFFQFA